MRFQIKHEIEGRLRVHMMQNRMTFAEADTLQYYLEGLPGVAHAKVYEKTCDAVVTYTAERADNFLMFGRGRRSDRITLGEPLGRAHGTLQPVWMKVS